MWKTERSDFVVVAFAPVAFSTERDPDSGMFTSGPKWKKIPWLTDLAEGVELAKKEKRPLFLWVAADPPLERC